MQPRQSLDRPAWNSGGGWDAHKHRDGNVDRGKNYYTKACNQIGKDRRTKK